MKKSRKSKGEGGDGDEDDEDDDDEEEAMPANKDEKRSANNMMLLADVSSHQSKKPPSQGVPLPQGAVPGPVGAPPAFPQGATPNRPAAQAPPMAVQSLPLTLLISVDNAEPVPAVLREATQRGLMAAIKVALPQVTFCFCVLVSLSKLSCSVWLSCVFETGGHDKHGCREGVHQRESRRPHRHRRGCESAQRARRAQAHACSFAGQEL